MSESLVEELQRRAWRLLELDGWRVGEDERELVLDGWSDWPIVIASECIDDLNKTVYLTIYYEIRPHPLFILSTDPDHGQPAEALAPRYVPEIVDALRRRLLLDDLADV